MSVGALSRTGGRTIDRIAVTGRPSREDLVDAAFLLVLGLIALWGFRTSFASLEFIAVGGVGLVLGILVAHVANTLRQSWLVLALMTFVTFFLFGGVVALRGDALGGVLPNGTVLADLARLPIRGWKDFLTTLPPVDGNSQFLVLPYLIGLLVGVIGLAWARRTSAMAWPVLVPIVALALVIALGTYQAVAALPQGLAFTAVAFLWVAARRRRSLRIIGTGGGTRSQVLVGALLVAASLGIGVGVVQLSPGTSDRLVLRSVVEPPFDITQQPSPLVGFRKYTEGAARVWDQPLLTVTGAAAGERLRLAVLDDYSGTVWAAAGPTSPAAGSFRRVGSNIAAQASDPTTTPETIQVRIEKAYAAQADVSLWVPGLGASSKIAFTGPRAEELAKSLRYNTITGQGVVSSRLAEGDVIDLVARPTALVPAEGVSPGGGSLVSAAQTDIVAATTSKWVDRDAVTPWEQVMAVARTMKERGAYSDGTAVGETHYLPGHGAGRISRFLAGRELVGNDEQYASTFALAANQLGLPTRVVLGAVIPDGGTIKGQDVRAWVEVLDSSGRWFAVPEATFTPNKDKRPNVDPPPPPTEQAAENVPPPNAVRPPGSLDSLLSVDPATVRVPPNEVAGGIPSWVWTVLTWIAVPIAVLLLVMGLIAGIHGVRRRRRRGTGPSSRRLALGWTDLVDRARDLGMTVPKGITRQEQARLIGYDRLAAEADEAIFGGGEPSSQDVAQYWKATSAARRQLTKRAPRKRRLLRRFTLTSLLFRDPRPVEHVSPPTPRGRRRRRRAPVPAT